MAEMVRLGWSVVDPNLNQNLSNNKTIACLSINNCHFFLTYFSMKTHCFITTIILLNVEFSIYNEHTNTVLLQFIITQFVNIIVYFCFTYSFIRKNEKIGEACVSFKIDSLFGTSE